MRDVTQTGTNFRDALAQRPERARPRAQQREASRPVSDNSGIGKNKNALQSCWRLAVWICLLFCFAYSAAALEVQEVRWGFDGQVVPGRFNLLSVLVANSSAAPFDGALKLYKDMNSEVYGAPCYVSALTARWLQFYVFIDNEYVHWHLDWGRGASERYDMDPPKWSRPAQVMLSDSEMLGVGGTAFKQFPDELFPPTAAAADGLDSVLLDHAPRWEGVKRQAFLSWLRAGGKVHLLQGADGHYPVFADELSVLNAAEPRLRVGSGTVVRHGASAREIRRRDILDADAPPGEFSANEKYETVNTEESFLRTLAQLSQRRYNWAAIYLLAFAYLALAGPGQFFWGRKIGDYRLRIGLLLAIVAAFAFLFNLVGRRGLGERNVVHSLSYARSIGGGSYDVLQWDNVFAARGSHYSITHGAPHNLYSVGRNFDAVNGVIQGGKDGRLVLDIPMFSRRAFVHQAEMKGHSIPLTVQSWTGADTVKHLVVAGEPDLPKQVLMGWVAQGNRLYALKTTAAGLEFDDGDTESLTDSG
ncbi:MAG TPA: hypothetical protein VF988_17630, partial [Verrucomicrobiae bacterium]